MDLEQRGIGVVARFFEAFATLAAEHSILEVVRRRYRRLRLLVIPLSAIY